MGQFFSDDVETALRCIYYDLAAGRGQEGLDILEEAARRGDADACCVLARCLYGPEYTWLGHQFPVDAERGDALMRQAVLGGSAMAALTAMRSGVMDEDLERAMPFSDLSVPFRIVLGGAEQGDPFCQMVIGNVYYWWDFLRIEQRGAGDFPDDDASRLYLRSRFLQCESWYLSSFRAGCAASGTNLIRLYSEGEKDLVPPRPEKELELDRRGAELGFPNYQYFYACDLCGDGREEEGYALHRTAAERGEPRAFYWAGYAWEYGLGGPKDEARAAEYYRRGIRASYIKNDACYIRLGQLYYFGQGVPQDYEKAFQLFQKADELSNQNQAAYYLGFCCAFGYGTEQDYAAARTYLERVDWDCPDAFYLLGWMYCHGKGGPEDIDKGVALLRKAGDLPEAKEELSHYRQALFTRRWVRR